MVLLLGCVKACTNALDLSSCLEVSTIVCEEIGS